MNTIGKQKSQVIVVDFKKNQEVKTIPQSQQLPLGLKLLLLLQKSSSICSLLLVIIALTIFGLTLKIPQSWDTEYKKLKTLQRQERQLTVTNENERNNLIEQTKADDHSLVYPKPENIVFLSILTPENNQDPITQESESVNTSMISDSPLAY